MPRKRTGSTSPFGPAKSAFDNGFNTGNEFREKRSELLKSARIFILGTAGLIFNLSLSSPSFANPKAQFSIVYSNDVMAEVEPCG
jgi:hypothetical protein